MSDRDPFYEQKLQRLQLLIYLVPVLGCLPALWTLSRHQSSREQQSISRLSVTLALVWLLVYSLLWLGATQTPDLLTFRLQYLNTLLTSGYFLVCLGLMVRLWQGKSLNLPRMSKIVRNSDSKS